jgi:Holliday junction resolvasome RuvABC endonuclease subunit
MISAARIVAPPKPGFVLSIHPTSRGFGWIVVEGPFAPHDWGLAAPRQGDKNIKCLEHVEKLISRYEPEVLVLEAFEKGRSKRADRIARLGRGIVALATDRSIEVAIYTRGEVKACFARVGAVSRQEIAEAVSRHLPALRHKMPKPRKPWESDHPRMALFSAAALILTHYQYRASQFLDDLSKKAAEMDED